VGRIRPPLWLPVQDVPFRYRQVGARSPNSGAIRCARSGAPPQFRGLATRCFHQLDIPFEAHFSAPAGVSSGLKAVSLVKQPCPEAGRH
jgi:hypothetical protein